MSALPTMLRVPLLERENRVRVLPSASYGFTESVLSGADRHHRMVAGAGVAGSAENGLAAELRADGRYDRHVGPTGQDDGVVFEARAFGRYTHPLTGRASLGGQLGLWVPGEEAPVPVFKAATVDALVILGWRPTERVAVTLDAGYRRDNSARSVKDAARLTQADWTALGLSDFDSVLAGVGAQHTLDQFRWFIEANVDVLVGHDAPRFTHSPIRLAAGVSTALYGPETRGSLVAQGLLSARSPADVAGPLVPFEPRFVLSLAVSRDFTWGTEVAPTRVAPAPRASPDPGAPRPVPAAGTSRRTVPEPQMPTLPLGVLRVMVRDAAHGEAVAARIQVKNPHGEDVVATRRTAPAGGAVEVELNPGEYSVEVSADGFVAQRRRLTVDENGVTLINVDLRPSRGR
jgi:hypothetical protein